MHTLEQLQSTADNLDTLAAFIDERVPAEQINMQYFSVEGQSPRALLHNYLKNDSDVHACGTSGCAMGWAPLALRDEILKLSKFPTKGYMELGSQLFPGLYRQTDKSEWVEPTLDWNAVFHQTLSSDKTMVVGRLRSMADTLRQRAEETTA